MMKYVEFIGTPGSGKSTIVKSIVDRHDNVSVVDEFSTQLNSSRAKNIICLIKSFPFYFLPKYHNLKKCYFSWMKNEKLTQKSELRYMFVSIALFMNSYSKMKKRKDSIIVCDQGAVQHLVSILYDKKISDRQGMKRLLEGLFSMAPLYRMVFVDVDLDKNINRLKNRKNGISRIDGLIRTDFDKGKLVLQNQRDNFHLIADSVSKDHYLILDANTAADCDEIVMDWIENRGAQDA